MFEDIPEKDVTCGANVKNTQCFTYFRRTTIPLFYTQKNSENLAGGGEVFRGFNIEKGD